jgi:hypothetical protein
MTEEAPTTERHAIQLSDAGRIANWFATRGGIRVWESINLSNPSGSWTTPATKEDGSEATKPTWEAGSWSRLITDPAEVDVITAKEVKRFHVAVRMGDQGLSCKVTDGGSRRIRAEVAKAEEKYSVPAWHEFDYADYNNAVILVEAEKVPLPDFLKSVKSEPTA